MYTFTVTNESCDLQPESIYESSTPQLREYFESVDGRVKLIHETFNQIGILFIFKLLFTSTPVVHTKYM